MKQKQLQLQYLEIVTNDVETTCKTYAENFGLTFSEPVVELGNARTAELSNGGRLGVRGPLREDENPIVRPYALVDDVAASVAAAEAAGAKIAHPPMELPGQGIFAIYILGGIEHGLWQHVTEPR